MPERWMLLQGAASLQRLHLVNELLAWQEQGTKPFEEPCLPWGGCGVMERLVGCAAPLPHHLSHPCTELQKEEKKKKEKKNDKHP